MFNPPKRDRPDIDENKDFIEFPIDEIFGNIPEETDIADRKVLPDHVKRFSLPNSFIDSSTQTEMDFVPVKNRIITNQNVSGADFMTILHIPLMIGIPFFFLIFVFRLFSGIYQEEFLLPCNEANYLNTTELGLLIVERDKLDRLLFYANKPVYNQREKNVVELLKECLQPKKEEIQNSFNRVNTTIKLHLHAIKKCTQINIRQNFDTLKEKCINRAIFFAVFSGILLLAYIIVYCWKRIFPESLSVLFAVNVIGAVIITSLLSLRDLYIFNRLNNEDL